MTLSIPKLFKRNEQQAVSQPASGIAQANSNSKQQAQTYSGWGKRICATSFGSDLVLAPFLLNVYNYIKREQAQDQQYQLQARAEYEAQIQQNDNNIEAANERIKSNNQQIENNNNLIEELNNQKTEIKTRLYTVNKDAKAKFILGLIILIPLTFYLFLFYSSTFYSAFIADSTSYTSASAAMFNADAYRAAANKGIVSLCLIIAFPIIFMGLGFTLHYFSEQKNQGRYFKMAAILFVTLMFDCILAFRIGQTIHNALVNNALIPESKYDLGAALSDVSFWAVIFCGFIAYIIWGLVFDQTMDALSKKDQNKIELQAISDKIGELNTANADLNVQTQAEQNKITELKNQNESIKVKLIGTVFFDESKIRLEMNNFFSGWQAQLAFLGKSTEEQESAQNVFNQCITNLKLA